MSKQVIPSKYEKSIFYTFNRDAYKYQERFMLLDFINPVAATQSGCICLIWPACPLLLTVHTLWGYPCIVWEVGGGDVVGEHRSDLHRLNN